MSGRLGVDQVGAQVILRSLERLVTQGDLGLLEQRTALAGQPGGVRRKLWGAIFIGFLGRIKR